MEGIGQIPCCVPSFVVVSRNPSQRRTGEMRKAWLPGWVWVLFICAGLLGSKVTVSALEEGEVTGRIERVNAEFLRDYEKLDYGDRGNWAEWGKGLRSLGWVVVQGDSGEPRDHLLLVIDSRTQVL